MSSRTENDRRQSTAVGSRLSSQLCGKQNYHFRNGLFDMTSTQQPGDEVEFLSAGTEHSMTYAFGVRAWMLRDSVFTSVLTGFGKSDSQPHLLRDLVFSVDHVDKRNIVFF